MLDGRKRSWLSYITNYLGNRCCLSSELNLLIFPPRVFQDQPVQWFSVSCTPQSHVFESLIDDSESYGALLEEACHGGVSLEVG